MKTLILALLFTLPGCLAELDPTLPQQVEQTIDNPSPPIEPDDAGPLDDAAPKGVPSHNIPHDL